MRATEFITESLGAEQVLQYVKQAHAPEQFDIDSAITDHPDWELRNIPLSQLKLDPDGEEADPYGRVNWVDYDKVRDMKPGIGSILKRMPIVVDSQGWIIDGNHRAAAAAEAGLTSVPAYVPVTQLNENFADGKVKGKSRPGRVKRAGASCDGSVTDLRAKAKKYGGEKGKMYHWCANMKGGKKKVSESKVDPEHFSREKLDELLSRCIKMVFEKGLHRSDEYGRVGACIVDTRNRKVFAVSTKDSDGKWIHAEHMAIKKYQKDFGKILPGSIIITTLSPCNREMHDRSGPSCQDLLQQVGIEKVYTGYMDPTQHSDHPFSEELTENDDLWRYCKRLSDSFVHQH